MGDQPLVGEIAGVPARLAAGVEERRLLGGGEEAEADFLAAVPHLQFVLLAASLLWVVVDEFVAGAVAAAGGQSQALPLRIALRPSAVGAARGCSSLAASAWPYSERA